MNRNTYTHLMVAIAMILVTGCAGTMDRPPSEDQLIWSTGDRPAWTLNDVEASGDEYQFLGMSEKHSTERGARAAALADARRKATQYFGTTSSSEREELLEGTGLSSETLEERITITARDRQTAAAHLVAATPSAWYLEQYRDQRDRTYWRAFVQLDLSQRENRNPAERAKLERRDRERTESTDTVQVR